MAEHQSNDHSTSTVEDLLNVLRLKLCDACDSSLKPENDRKLNEISDWVKEQKKKEKDRADPVFVEDVGKVLRATINNIEKFSSGDPLEITRGVLDIISSAAQLLLKHLGVPYADHAVGALYTIISWILTKIFKPKQPSVVDQLANVVHEELVHFNKRLQNQKYEGLKRRVSDQNSQLRTMTPGEKLDDPNLWNDYVQFMGELSNRFESPLPFKYEDNLREDPDVADFVIAVVTYCEAFCCFMALLFAAKGKFAELGSAYKEDENAVDRKISCQLKDAKEKLSFLSEERYLTFLGRLPYEGGKLIKIVVLNRIMDAKIRVEAVRGSLGLTQMQDLDTVEAAASKVARQSVKGKVERHQVPPEVGWWEWFFGPPYWVQIINETNFPIKIFLRRRSKNAMFVQDVQPRSSFQRGYHLIISTCGYINIYPQETLSPNIDPSAKPARVIEFAFSFLKYPKINIQDKTNDEFSYGQDTYNRMTSGKAEPLFWPENRMHFIAIAEIVRLWFGKTVCRFVIQDFDPCSVQD